MTSNFQKQSISWFILQELLSNLILSETRLDHKFYQYKELIIILLELNTEQYIK